MNVAVVLPTYKAGTWLDEAIESIFDQSYQHWHLTLIDDASPEMYFKRLKAWRDRHPKRISLIRRKQNGGAAIARMDAIMYSSADVLTFIDQDDLWMPEKLTCQIDHFIKHPNLQALHTDIQIIDEIGAIKEGAADSENTIRAAVLYNKLSRHELAFSLFKESSIRVISSAIRRDAFLRVGGFDSTLHGGEDWEFWVRFANCFSIDHLNIALMKRREHKNNTSKVQRISRIKGQLVALKKMQLIYPFPDSEVKEKQAVIINNINRLCAMAEHRNQA